MTAIRLASRFFSFGGEEVPENDKCAICLALSVKESAFNRLFSKINKCRLCSRNVCTSHCESLPFAQGMIPSRAENPTVCSDCTAHAHRILDDEIAEARIERFNLAASRRGETTRTLEKRSVAPREESRMCIECDAIAKSQCDLCGITLCLNHANQYPTSSGPKATGRIKICNQCVGLASVLAEARTLVRAVVAAVHRSALSAKCLDLSMAKIAPSKEDAEDCASCGLLFGKLPGSLRHHCRACGRSLCSVCLCGKSGCLALGPACPHKAILSHLGFTKEERVCHECLYFVQVRSWSCNAVQAIVCIAQTIVNHHDRTSAFVQDPTSLPLYEQDYVDTASAKVGRVGDFTVAGAKTALPFLSVPWAMGVHAVNAVWKYGQYGLVGLLAREEVVQGLKTLQSVSSILQDMSTKDVMVGAYYLSAQQRKTLRDDPTAARSEASTNGQSLPLPLLESLIGFALLGGMAPYQERPFDAQRLAMQHNWRLVTERLRDSGKHRPAWCLFARHEHKLATIAIRGTDLDASAGGDVWTDLNVLPEIVRGFGGMNMLVHGGALAAARLLEFELRPTLRVLVNAGYEIAFIGHSIGGAIAAILLWLIRFGSIEERLPDARTFGIGYGSPSVVDRTTAEALRPFFTSIVNSMDIVPRLSVSILQQLAREIQASATASSADLDQDISAHLNRMSKLWEPRLRNGLPSEPNSSICSPRLASPTCEEEVEVESESVDESSTAVDGMICVEQFIGQTLESSKDTYFEQQDEKQLTIKDVELYVPGSAVWIHRVNGHLEAAVMPCNAWSLRRIVLNTRIMEDHRAVSYHKALDAVRRRTVAEEMGGAASDAIWQRFCDSGTICPCCGSAYDWMQTSRSEKNRVNCMTNCRICGRVVCTGCASTYRAVPETGILEPARVCDTCLWRGPDDADTFLRTASLLEGLARNAK